MGVIIIASGTGLLVERIIPAVPCPIRGILFNVFYFVPAALLQAAAVSGVTALMVTVTNTMGGGVVVLPSEGWRLIPAIAAFTLAMDFGEYVFHRTQHRIPALWAMHSLHHSDETMNLSTTVRHFWADQAIKTMTIYL